MVRNVLFSKPSRVDDFPDNAIGHDHALFHAFCLLFAGLFGGCNFRCNRRKLALCV